MESPRSTFVPSLRWRLQSWKRSKSDRKLKTKSSQEKLTSAAIAFVSFPTKMKPGSILFFQTMMYCKHRCTKVENPGGGGPGVSKIFAKIPKGGQGFQEKLPWRYPYFGFYCIFINQSFDIRLGVLCLTSPLPPSRLIPRVHLWL